MSPRLDEDRLDVHGEGVSPSLDRSDALGLCALEVRTAKLDAAGLHRLQRSLGPLRDQVALLLGYRSVQVKNEWIHVRPKLGDDERRAMRHKP